MQPLKIDEKFLKKCFGTPLEVDMCIISPYKTIRFYKNGKWGVFILTPTAYEDVETLFNMSEETRGRYYETMKVGRNMACLFYFG